MLKRHVLWWLIMLQTVCNMFVMLSLNIAIISMVDRQEVEMKSVTAESVVCPNTSVFLKDFVKDESRLSSAEGIKLEWSEAEENTALSGYYWLNYFSMLPGGVLAFKYGSKRIVGYTQLVSSALSSLIPMVAGYGPLVVSWVRAVQGFLSYLSVPAGMYSIIGNWSPPEERAKFGAATMVGTSIGLMLGSFLFGYIAFYAHWKYVFHFTSVCGVVLSVVWFELVYDLPEEHPTISAKEKEFIRSSLKEAAVRTKAAIPWKSIITSVPVIVCVLGMNSSFWGFVMITTYSPLYLKTTYGLDSNEIGILTSLPHLLVIIAALGIAYFSDLAIKREWFSLTRTRKICAFFGGVISSIPLVVIAFTKCNLGLVIACLLVHCITRTFCMYGPSLSIMDMSPKFCGILEGLSGTLSSVTTFLIAAMVNYYSNVWHMEFLWKMVFVCTALYCVATHVVYLIFGTSKVQSWNFEDDRVVEQFSKESQMKNEVEVLLQMDVE